ncbi:CHAD domain-containing protein [Stieleria sp. ICT_E10.1]|uniref:CHAD domain-containing protein n=1 Tax=Stieleria sedimenti TaxID=2976331 RepID=UPI00218084C4|nr:CHAD domain-containing protein [Stieleria sedimenti]MCS7470882.1 CHAD domain-containing protein [Stieleria sedimenti]
MSSKRNKSKHGLPAQDTGKWVRLENAEGCVATAARLTLSSRLAAVLYHLPRASSRSDASIEHVHQLRVSTRRVIAVLQLYKDVLPDKQALRMERRMKRIRQVAGVARDLDVLALRYRDSDSQKHKRLVRRLTPLRRKARRSIADLNHALMDKDHLARRVKKLLKSIRCQSPQDLKAFAKTQLAQRSQCFFKHAKRDLDRIDELHRFRIQAKRFRYTVELLGDVLPAEIRTEIYPVVCNVQELLGELHDHSIARERMKRLACQERKSHRATQFKVLARNEKRKMKQAESRFRQWWTPSFCESLERSIERVLQDPSG